MKLTDSGQKSIIRYEIFIHSLSAYSILLIRTLEGILKLSSMELLKSSEK